MPRLFCMKRAHGDVVPRRVRLGEAARDATAALALLLALLLLPALLIADDAAAPAPDEAADVIIVRPEGERADGAGEDDADDDADDAEADEGEDEESDEPRQISIALANVEMRELAQFLAEELNQPVIVDNAIAETKVTIIAPQQLPLEAAIRVLRSALLQNEVLLEQNHNFVTLRSSEHARRAALPMLDADADLADFDDQAVVVSKVYRLLHYDADALEEAVEPIISEFGHITADAASRRFVVTDTIANLRRVERIIDSLDVPGPDRAMTRIIRLEHADAPWLVRMLETMLGGEREGPPRQGGWRAQQIFQQQQAQRGSITVETNDGNVMLMPEIMRNWIIVVAPELVIERVQAWVDELDTEEASPTDFVEMIRVEHADVAQLAQQLQQTIESLPNRDIAENVRVAPFPGSRQVLVIGSRRGRQLVADLIERLDHAGAGHRVMHIFELRHADANEIADNIDMLFSQEPPRITSPWMAAYMQPVEQAVRITVNMRRNTVTVFADAETIERIKGLMEQWDQPLSTDDVEPRIYQLQHADPREIRDTLDAIFAQQQSTGTNFWAQILGTSSEPPPVGRLAGQFGFEALPGARQLVVTTPNPENYQVIDNLVKRLDQPQEAGLPEMIELNHAYAEDVAEQLNTMLAESGTLAELDRTRRQLSSGTRAESVIAVTGDQPAPQQSDDEDEADPGRMPFWWQQSSRPLEDEATTSNLIGRIRVVPIARQNALLVLAPPAYSEPVHNLVNQLDQPGKQVVIHVIIAEVQHDDATTLGVRLASDPRVFDETRLRDQSIGGSGSAGWSDIFGGTYTVDGTRTPRGILSADFDVHALVQFLMRETAMNIMLEPRLYTADNREAEFFDGQDISVQTSAQFTPEGTQNFGFRYAFVGTRLRVRPHITHNGDVDLHINLELSRIVPGENTMGNPIIDRRETNTQIIVADGETVLLSGIVEQEEFRAVRKLPLLGDIPLLGLLFRSSDHGYRNREIIAFITPRVISASSDESRELSDDHRQELERLRQQLPPHFLLYGEEEAEAEDEGDAAARREQAGEVEDDALDE
ncbi:MAG: secretin N-terminal domain-containing protein [Phycisphaeraceae bacterium]